MKYAASLLAAACLASTAALADQTVTNAQWNFEVTLPDGWVDANVSDGEVVAAFNGPQIEGTNTNCNVTANNSADTASMTQFQINAEVTAGGIAEQSVAEAKSIDPNTQVLAQDVVEQNGIAIQRADFIMNFPRQDGGAAIPVHARKIIAVIPGRYYNMNCMVVQSGYEQVKGNFDSILGSFKITK